jgi:hypothetical protein
MAFYFCASSFVLLGCFGLMLGIYSSEDISLIQFEQLSRYRSTNQGSYILASCDRALHLA